MEICEYAEDPIDDEVSDKKGRAHVADLTTVMHSQFSNADSDLRDYFKEMGDGTRRGRNTHQDCPQSMERPEILHQRPPPRANRPQEQREQPDEHRTRRSQASRTDRQEAPSLGKKSIEKRERQDEEKDDQPRIPNKNKSWIEPQTKTRPASRSLFQRADSRLKNSKVHFYFVLKVSATDQTRRKK